MFQSLFTPYHLGQRFSLKFLAVSFMVLLGVLWFIAPASTGIPTPMAVGRSWESLARSGGLLYELMTSTKVIWEALVLSSLLSIGIAALYSADIFKPAATMVASFRFLGFAGLTFLFTLWSSSQHELKVMLLTFGMTVFLTRSTIDVLKSIPQSEIDYARSLGISGWGLTWVLFVRGRIDVLLDLIRQNAAVGWTLLAMVEGITRSEGGIGGILLNQNKYFRLDAVFAIQFTILAYGLLQDVALQYLRSTVCPWTNLNRSDK